MTEADSDREGKLRKRVSEEEADTLVLASSLAWHLSWDISDGGKRKGARSFPVEVACALTPAPQKGSTSGLSATAHGIMPFLLLYS